MFEKFEEWLEFHSKVMKRYPRPGFLMIFSCVISVVVSWLYPRMVMAIAQFEIGGHAPYQNFVIQNINYFKIGMWVVPILVFIILMSVSWRIHQSNVRKHYQVER